jgi:antitoxin component HigA of HigAB toxin-antitoxin module
MPRSYEGMCRDVWLPRPIHDRITYKAALAAVEPFWGREKEMTKDQADWFELVTSLIGAWEDASSAPGKSLPLAARLSQLLESTGLTAAGFARLLNLDASMGSKILKGERQLTAAHVVRLAEHFRLAPAFFLP